MAKRTSATSRRPAKRTRTATAKTARRRTSLTAKAARAQRATKRGAARQAAPEQTSRNTSTLGSVATAVRGAATTALVAVTRTISGRPADDAITVLKNDHRRMEGLLKRGEETTARAAKRRTHLLDTISSELKAHETIEEKLFYPALRSHPQARAIVNEAYEEHHAADGVVGELRATAAGTERWTAKFQVLKEMVEHHIDEEEGPMFRTARAVLSQNELTGMGRKMAAMKARAKRS